MLDRSADRDIFGRLGYFTFAFLLLLSLLPSSEAYADSTWTTKTPMPAARSYAAAAVIDSILYVAGGHDGSGGTTTLQAYNPAADTWSTLASMPGRRYQADGAGVINGKLYVPGGWNYPDSGLPTNTLFVYDPATNSWSTGAPMPQVVLYGSGNGASGVINGKLYVTTPYNGYSGTYKYLHVYDPATNTWTQLASSPNAHALPASGVIDNKLYIAGGSDGGNHNKLDVYDPVANSWTTKAPMPVSGSGFASAVMNGKLYAIGGNTAGGVSSAVYVYDPSTDTWTTETSMPTARAGAAAGVINGVIYVAGGSNSTGTLVTVEAFPVGGAWTTKTSMPAARSYAAAAVINGILYVAGGNGGSGPTSTLQAYNPATDTWSALASMPGSRDTGVGAGVIDGKLYVAGGWSGSLPTNTLFVYDPVANSWSTRASIPQGGMYYGSGHGASGVINGKLYVYTAATGYDGWWKYLHVYDPATNSWTQLPQSPNYHITPASGVIGDKFYVAGGDDWSGNSANWKKLDVYDPVTNAWTTKAPMPAGGRGFASAVFNGKLYVIGGDNVTSNNDTVYVYDPSTDAWTTETSMPTARAGAVAGVINGVIYVAGCGNATGNLAVVEALTLAPILAAPTGLTKISPDNNPLPAFKWSASANATSYEVKMDSGNWAGISSNLTYVQPTALSKASHTFSVRAKDAAGNAGAAASLSFSVTVAPVLSNTRIAFSSDRDGNREIYIMNADGSGQTRLTNNPAYDADPVWSPDGSKIAFSSYRDGNREIYVMNADGSNQTRLTNNSAADYGPSWSPDGSKIAFESYRDGNWETWVMNADGSNPTQLTNIVFYSNSGPAYSPDGSKIVFHSNRDMPSPWPADIYVMNADGSGQTRLMSNLANDLDPLWSPDGSKIVFHSDRDGNKEIYVMNADGSNQISLTNNPAGDSWPTYSPDGSKIAFYSDRDGNNEIYVMNADGSNQTRLTNDPASDSEPAWSPFVAGAMPPTVTTNDADSITTISARLSGNLTSLGTASSVNVSFQWGTSSGSNANETSFGAMTAAGPFNFNLTGLNPGTTYYYRATAAGDDISHGAEKSFTTSVLAKRLVNLPTTLKVWKLGAPDIDLSLTGQTEDTVAVIGPVVNSTNVPVVRLSLGFSQVSSDIDFGGQMTVDTDLVNAKAVFHRSSYPAGVSSTKALYVKKLPQHDRVRVVPGAQSLAEVYSGAPGSYVLTLADSDLSVITTLAGTEYWRISGLTGTGAMGETANQAPVAQFTYSPSSPRAGQVVMVDASTSSDADGTIANYSWDWGDGGNSSATTPTGLGHTYTAAGSYVVVLTVRDNLNATGSQAQTITVSASQSSSSRVRSLPDISTWALIASGLPLLGLRVLFSRLRRKR
ncbi:MAG: PD40 domain-containing protein [Chloroflexi bacterium]|nr:PD40 domain-containing protein [Chloroflexota bacterium]